MTAAQWGSDDQVTQAMHILRVGLLSRHRVFFRQSSACSCIRAE